MATQPPTPTMKDGDYFDIKCAKPECQQTFQLLIPRIETVNQRTYSAYHFSHENLQQCPFCGQAYMFQLGPMGAQGLMRFTFRPVQEAPEKRIIVASGDALRGLN